MSVQLVACNCGRDIMTLLVRRVAKDKRSGTVFVPGVENGPAYTKIINLREALSSRSE